MSFPRSSQLRFVGDVSIELSSSSPEGVKRALFSGVVPNTGGDYPARPRDPAHFAQSGVRVGHEMDDELSKGCIKGSIVERQIFGSGLSNLDLGKALLRCNNEAFGWIHRRHCCGAKSLG